MEQRDLKEWLKKDGNYDPDPELFSYRLKGFFDYNERRNDISDKVKVALAWGGGISLVVLTFGLIIVLGDNHQEVSQIKLNHSIEMGERGIAHEKDIARMTQEKNAISAELKACISGEEKVDLHIKKILAACSSK